MMNNFVKRTLTGILFVVVVLGSIYLSKYSFIVLFFLINLFTLFEFYSRSENKPLKNIHAMGLLSSSSFFILLAFWQLGWIQAKYLLISAPLLFSIFIIALNDKDKNVFIRLGKIFTGLFLITLPLSLLLWFVFEKGTYIWQLAAIPLVLTWINDVFAYLGGMLFGKHKLAAKLSPKKTVEGFTIGLLFTIIGALAISWYAGAESIIIWVILGLIISISAVLGDLVESKWKRELGIKESGNMLPGHGGLLDRFDAFLFVIPFYVIFIKLFVS
ncbi:MAG: CDP-archaeol synthase [Bacteroidetes bacterium]|nr:CDP-archaeol synthase [Bacteroidota bacterium]